MQFVWAKSPSHLHTGMRRMLYPRMHMGIAVCTRGSPYAYGDSFLKKGDHCMHMAIPICIGGWVGCCIPICIWGLLYAYGDLHMHMGVLSMLLCTWEMGRQQHHQSLYAHDDWHGPRMHMGINNIQIPVCIWGSYQSPDAYRDSPVTNRLHMVIVCIWGFGHQIPICKNLHMRIPVDPSLHTGIYCFKLL